MSLALCLALAVAPAHAPPNHDGGRVALAPAPQLHWNPLGLFEPYLPGCSRLRRVDGGLVAFADFNRYELTDLEKGTASWERRDASEPRIQDLVCWRGEKVRLLVECDEKLTVEAFHEDAWVPLQGSPSNPEISRDAITVGAGGYPLIAADGEHLVVLTGTTLYSYESGDWRSIELGFLDGEYAAPASRLLLDGATLYVGTDKGEWGGALYGLDIDTREVSVVSAPWSDGDSNVADLDRGPDGRIWATIGCVHMNGFGELYVLERGAWRCVARAEDLAETAGHDWSEWPEVMASANRVGELPWRFPRSGFTALDFDDRGRPYLLTETFGVFRGEADGSWTWITRGWPTFQACVTDLAIVGERAAITSRFAGVVIVDLDTLEARRVRFDY